VTRVDAGGETGALERVVFGATFRNPVLLAAGTCGFGQELADVLELDGLGGLVTKSVTVEPRWGNPPTRVAEFGAGMVNSVGLTNPGLDAVRRDKLPWLARNLRRAQVLVSVAGHTVGEYERLVATLDASEGFLGFELNLSCPNDERLGGRPFALDPQALAETVSRCRARTERPLLVKLAPHDPDLAGTARIAEASGADGLTLMNTLPGLVLDPRTGHPALGAGEGGISGPALRPAAVRAVAVARRTVGLPLVGVGGIMSAADALEHLHAGASLVQVGTAGFAAPRASERIVRGLERAARRGDLPALPGLGATRRAPRRDGAPVVEGGSVPAASEVPWPR
jgi:dihydroorotate dehydrogenase (NAD+) catalytic subunit